MFIYLEFWGMNVDQIPVPLGFFLEHWFHTFSVGFWWPSFLTLMVSLERFVASAYPIWYSQNKRNRKAFLSQQSLSGSVTVHMWCNSFDVNPGIFGLSKGVLRCWNDPQIRGAL